MTFGKKIKNKFWVCTCGSRGILSNHWKARAFGNRHIKSRHKDDDGNEIIVIEVLG